jgi:hypothetical protein
MEFYLQANEFDNKFRFHLYGTRVVCYYGGAHRMERNGNERNEKMFAVLYFGDFGQDYVKT